MREAWRLQKPGLQEKINANKFGLTVFFIYTGKELPQYNVVYQKIGAGIKNLNDWSIYENHSTHTESSLHFIDKALSMDHFTVDGTEVPVYTHLFSLCTGSL